MKRALRGQSISEYMLIMTVLLFCVFAVRFLDRISHDPNSIFRQYFNRMVGHISLLP